MNLTEEIFKEHSKSNALRIADYACESEENLKELFTCFIGDEPVLAQRAAWSVGWVGRRRPDLIQHHMKEIILVLSRRNVHPAITRNSLRALEEVDIPKKFQGKVMENCFRFLEEVDTTVAIKVFSLTILFKLAQHYPDIKRELKIIIDDNQDHQSPAFKSRAGKLLTML